LLWSFRLSCLSSPGVKAVLSRLFSLGWPALATLFRLSCPGCLSLVDLLRLSRPNCPAPFSCYSCCPSLSVLSRLCWLSCNRSIGFSATVK
jgi:hypothetical protein